MDRELYARLINSLKEGNIAVIMTQFDVGMGCLMDMRKELLKTDRKI